MKMRKVLRMISKPLSYSLLLHRRRYLAALSLSGLWLLQRVEAEVEGTAAQARRCGGIVRLHPPEAMLTA